MSIQNPLENPLLGFFCNQFMDHAGAGDAYISVTRILMEGECLKRTRYLRYLSCGCVIIEFRTAEKPRLLCCLVFFFLFSLNSLSNVVPIYFVVLV